MMAEASPHISYLVAPGLLVDGTFLVSPFPAPPLEFRDRFRKCTVRRAGPHNDSGYLAALAALNAIEHANSREASAIREACTSLGQFDAKGDTTENPPSGYEAKNGEFEFVEFLE